MDKNKMIDSILLVDDENLFHMVFEDACSLLDITLGLQTLSNVKDAENLFKQWNAGNGKRVDCVFVDLNIIGSSYDGIEMVRKINNELGNNVVIGIISSSIDPVEIEKAKKVGAQFWILKSDDIEPRLENFKNDYEGYKNHSLGFKVYK